VTDAAGLPVVYVDEALIVLNKPAGLLSVPGRGQDKQDCLSTRVQDMYADALVVHRLDMSTSGLLVMARGAHAQRALNGAFAQRAVHKRYVAVVAGHAPASGNDGSGWGSIELPIRVDWERRPLRIIDPVLGKPSTTRWCVLAHDRVADTTRLALEPVTGRSHQLRVHLQALGHPILGDALYAPAHIAARAPRLLLHAEHLAFAHPVGGHAMAFTSPADF